MFPEIGRQFATRAVFKDKTNLRWSKFEQLLNFGNVWVFELSMDFNLSLYVFESIFHKFFSHSWIDIDDLQSNNLMFFEIIAFVYFSESSLPQELKG